MSNETLFYICGIVLAVSAVTVSVVGLKLRDFPGKALPLVVLWFVVFVGGATTFAVLHAQEEQQAKAAELSEAGEEVGRAERGAPVEAEEKEEAPKSKTGTKGAATTLQLSASPTQIAFNTTKLNSQAGQVTIDFTNPSALEHDVAIEQNGKQIAISETVAEGKTSVSAELEPGTYTFLCTVPGHAEAGMEGTLTVQ